MKISAEACRTMLDALGTLLNSGKLRIYTGTAPDSLSDPTAGTLLAELTLANPAFSAAEDTNPGARIEANTVTSDDEANNSGTANWFRAFKADGSTGVIDGSVSAEGGGGELELENTDVEQGGLVSISSWIISMQES